MATIAKKASKKTDKPKLAQEIINKLEVALESFKEVWGEKRFKSRVKKASKLFLKGKPKGIPVKKKVAAPKKKVAVPKKKAANQAVKKQAPVKK